MIVALALTAAVVTGDHVALRATAARTSAQQAVLWKGDWLEVRGTKKVGSSRVDLQACKLEYSIVSPK